MNKIKVLIENCKDKINEVIASGLTTPEKVEENRQMLDMPMDMFCSFQNLKSLASMTGLLTLEESSYVYKLLGSQPSHFNSNDIATKLVLTKLYEKLLTEKIDSMRNSG